MKTGAAQVTPNRSKSVVEALQDLALAFAAAGATGDMQLLVPPRMWSALNTEHSSLRRYSTYRATNGTEDFAVYVTTGRVIVSADYTRGGRDCAYCGRAATAGKRCTNCGAP